MLELLLVRHAPTTPNAERRYPATGEDAPLTREGEAVARALGVHLRGPFDRVCVSPSVRARQTAYLAGFENSVSEPALGEANFGIMAGLTWAEVEARHGAPARTWIDALADPESDGGPPGGESGREFHGRVRIWLDAISAAHPAGRVLAFTHAGPLRAALRVTVGLGAVDVHPGRITVLRCVDGAWWLDGLNVG